MLLVAFSILSFVSCATTKKDYTITYPAGLVAAHPDSFYGCYVRLIGVLTNKRVQDQFPPFGADDPLLCDKSGCIYVHDDTQDLSRFIGKKVKVVGYVRISRFYFPYIEVEKCEVVRH